MCYYVCIEKLEYIMAKNVFDTLKERGFIKQTVYEEDLCHYDGQE